MTQEATRLFLSFADEDKALADALAEFLALGCGLSHDRLFYTGQPGHLAAGTRFGDTIRQALQSSKVSLHLLTPAYYRSKFCIAELGAVWATDKTHIPLLVPPSRFEDLDGVQLGEQALQVDVSSDLDELRDRISTSFGVAMPTAKWNEHKTAFLDRVAAIMRHMDESLEALQISFAAVRDHHQEAFWVDWSGQLWHRWYPEEHTEDWSEWLRMDGAPLAVGVATASNTDESLHLFVATRDGRIETRTWRLEDSWDAHWSTLSTGGASVRGPLGALSRAHNHLEVFAMRDTGAPVHRWAFSSDAGASWQWSDWHQYSAPA